MSSTEQEWSQGDANEPATHRLADLVPLAVVIAGGCEPCAERMVKRAVENGTPTNLIALTLGIVADLRSRECFADAVGPGVLVRMEQPISTARRVLAELAGPLGSRRC